MKNSGSRIKKFSIATSVCDRPLAPPTCTLTCHITATDAHILQTSRLPLSIKAKLASATHEGFLCVKSILATFAPLKCEYCVLSLSVFFIHFLCIACQTDIINESVAIGIVGAGGTAPLFLTLRA